MNDGQYTNIRNYLEEQNALLRQILEELRNPATRADGAAKLEKLAAPAVEAAPKTAAKPAPKKGK